jgi:predicted nuclease of predicted toxin-antitoxin system
VTRRRRNKIPFFTDNDVEDAVGDFLRDSGHTVQRLRDVMLSNSPDPIVDANCRENGLVLITHNYKHFKRIAHELRQSGIRIKPLSRIDMECHQSEAVDRLRELLPHIELEWQRKGGVGVRISICKATVRIHDD